MLKNVATTLIVYCWDATTGLPKTGDAANLTAYRTLDFGTVTVLADASATELDSTNAKGYYKFDLAQGETNGDYNLYTCKSSTSNVVCLAVPPFVHTLPTTGLLAPATAGRTLVVDAAGLADANVVKGGPSGSGVAVNANTITHLNQIFDTDYATIYDTTSKAFLSKLGNFAMGGSSLAVTYASSQDFTSTQKTSVTTAATAATPTAAAVTGNVGGNVVGSIGSLATQAKADVNAEADTALSDYGALKPTVAGRTLDVSAGGEAGIDLANVGSSGTTVNLSGVTVKAVTDGVTVASIASDAVSASALSSDAVAEIQNGLSTLTAAGVRTAVGLASANLDTQLTAIPTAAQNAAGLLDLAAAIEGLTPRQLGRLLAAVIAGKSTNGGTHFRDLADTKDRIAATLDGSNNRTAVTRDAT